MEESLSGRLFINSEMIGDYVEIVMPSTENKPEETIRIHYLEAGIGEPLILIHGIGQSLYTWRYLFAELSECYRVIAIDLPGHGYSGRPDHFCYSMDEMADAIKFFMDEKEIQSAHMIGFSTGSLYMMRVLSKYPDSIANCIAISPGGISNKMPSIIRSLKSPLKAIFSRNLFSMGDVKKCLQECLYNQTILDERMVRQYYEPISDGLSREALMYAVQNFDYSYVTDTLKDNDHEILLLWGKEDKWHNPNTSVFFQKVLQNGRYFLVRNAGHIVQEDAPEKLFQVILSYIPSPIDYYYQPEMHGGYYAEETMEQFRPPETPEEEEIPEEDPGMPLEEENPEEDSETPLEEDGPGEEKEE